MSYVPDFKPALITTYADENVPYSIGKYPAGEMHVRITNPDRLVKCVQVTIDANLTSGDAIMTFFGLVGALVGINPSIQIDLCLPYLPYSRQDRTCHPGEDFALKTFVHLLCDYMSNRVRDWSITTMDVHSSVSQQLFEEAGCGHRFEVIAAADLLFGRFAIDKYSVIVSPDAGAECRALGVAKAVDYKNPPPVIVMTKERDPDTGYLSKFGIATDLAGIDLTGSLLLVDDICDGGRTFIGAAKALRDAGFTGKLSLYVTHGIFSAGYTALSETFYEILVGNDISICTDPKPRNITVLS